MLLAGAGPADPVCSMAALPLVRSQFRSLVVVLRVWEAPALLALDVGPSPGAGHGVADAAGDMHAEPVCSMAALPLPSLLVLMPHGVRDARVADRVQFTPSLDFAPLRHGAWVHHLCPALNVPASRAFRAERQGVGVEPLSEWFWGLGQSS